MALFQLLVGEVSRQVTRREWGAAIMASDTQRQALARLMEVLIVFFNADGRGVPVASLHGLGYDDLVTSLVPAARSSPPAAAASPS